MVNASDAPSGRSGHSAVVDTEDRMWIFGGWGGPDDGYSCLVQALLGSSTGCAWDSCHSWVSHAQLPPATRHRGLWNTCTKVNIEGLSSCHVFHHFCASAVLPFVAIDGCFEFVLNYMFPKNGVLEFLHNVIGSIETFYWLCTSSLSKWCSS